MEYSLQVLRDAAAATKATMQGLKAKNDESAVRMSTLVDPADAAKVQPLPPPHAPPHDAPPAVHHSIHFHKAVIHVHRQFLLEKEQLYQDRRVLKSRKSFSLPR